MSDQLTRGLVVGIYFLIVMAIGAAAYRRMK